MIIRPQKSGLNEKRPIGIPFSQESSELSERFLADSEKLQEEAQRISQNSQVVKDGSARVTLTMTHQVEIVTKVTVENGNHSNPKIFTSQHLTMEEPAVTLDCRPR